MANYVAPLPGMQNFMEENRHPPQNFFEHANNYINDTANMNHEVQQCGLIPPSKIRYVGKRTLSEPAKVLGKQLIAKREKNTLQAQSIQTLLNMWACSTLNIDM